MQNIKNKSQVVLRIGLGITFLWIGYYILQAPEAWGQMAQPWMIDLLPVSLKTIMIATGIFDMAVGTFLILGIFTYVMAWLGFIHLAGVIFAIGFNAISVRDIGLAFATFSLVLSSWPEKKIIN